MLPKPSEMQYESYCMQHTKADYPFNFVGRISVPGFIICIDLIFRFKVLFYEMKFLRFHDSTLS